MLYSPGNLAFVITGIDFQCKTDDWNAAWPSISLAHGRAAATKDRNVSGALPVSSINRTPQYIGTIGESIEAFGNTCGDGNRAIVDVSTDAGAIAVSRCADSADLPVSTRSLSSTISDRGRQNTETRSFYSAAISQLAPRGDTDANRWERAHFLYELDHLGQLTRASRILVGATMADEAIALLSEVAERVDVIDLTGSPPRAGAEGRLFWSNGMLHAGDRLVISEGSLEEAEAASYDVVAFPHSSLFPDRISGAPSLLAKAERLFRPSGIF